MRDTSARKGFTTRISSAWHRIPSSPFTATTTKPHTHIWSHCRQPPAPRFCVAFRTSRSDALSRLPSGVITPLPRSHLSVMRTSRLKPKLSADRVIYVVRTWSTIRYLVMLCRQRQAESMVAFPEICGTLESGQTRL